jgi:hypothetical protein
MPLSDKARRICWICGGEVSLESCKVDEHGLPVHESCQTLKLSLRTENFLKRTSATIVRPERRSAKAG